MKTIKYSISDPDITHSIEIDECNLNNIISKIASELKLDEDQISIENPLPEEKFSTIDDKYVFKVQIKSGCGEINFHLPDNQNITIKNGTNYTFGEIMEHFRSKGICYSTECQKKNLQFKVFDTEIPLTKFPLKNFPPGFFIKIELTGKYVPISNKIKHFVFSENEQIEHVLIFIKEQFQNYSKLEYIRIQKKNSNYSLKSDYYLKSSEKYELIVKCPFKFCHVNISDHSMSQIISIESTVENAKNLLPDLLCDDHSIKPKDIIFFDNKRNKITDENELLINLMDKEFKIPFYFPISGRKDEFNKSIRLSSKEIEKHVQINESDVDSTHGSEKGKAKKNKFKPTYKEINSSNTEFDLKNKNKKKSKSEKKIDDDDENESKPSVKINFIFDKSNDKQIKSFSEKVPLDKTIQEIDDEISKKYEIDKQILIQYIDGDQKIAIEGDMTIEDVIDDIKYDSEKGQINVLNIKITSNPKKPKKEFKSRKAKQEKEKQKKEQEAKEQQEKLEKEAKEKEAKEQQEKLEKEQKEKERLEKEKQQQQQEKQAKEQKNENKNDNDDDDVVVDDDHFKINYQTNRDDKPKDAILELGTTVRQFKEMIAKDYEIKDIVNIKIIFAGKDLLNDIVLDQLNIGDIQLNIYIRTEQDILLMTCKALQFDLNELKQEEEEEEAPED